VITLSVLEGRFPIASLFVCEFSYIFVARHAVPLHQQSFLFLICEQSKV